jgi:hypothetical protein
VARNSFHTDGWATGNAALSTMESGTPIPNSRPTRRLRADRVLAKASLERSAAAASQAKRWGLGRKFPNRGAKLTATFARPTGRGHEPLRAGIWISQSVASCAAALARGKWRAMLPGWQRSRACV